MNSSCVEINAGSDGVEHRRRVHVPSLPPGDELTPVGKKNTTITTTTSSYMPVVPHCVSRSFATSSYTNKGAIIS